MSEPLEQIAQGLRAVYAAKHNHIQSAESGSFKRPDHWFTEQRNVLKMIELAGTEFAFIARNSASYLEWKHAVQENRFLDGDGGQK